jgi:hypothetical protein
LHEAGEVRLPRIEPIRALQGDGAGRVRGAVVDEPDLGARQLGLVEIRAGEPGAGQRRGAEIGVLQVGPEEVGAGEVGRCERALRERGFDQEGLLELGPPERRALVAFRKGQVGAGQVCARQDGARELRARQAGEPEIGAQQFLGLEIRLVEVREAQVEGRPGFCGVHPAQRLLRVD